MKNSVTYNFIRRGLFFLTAKTAALYLVSMKSYDNNAIGSHFAVGRIVEIFACSALERSLYQHFLPSVRFTNIADKANVFDISFSTANYSVITVAENLFFYE